MPSARISYCRFSHDEVVHGKGSLLRKMSGDDWQKFANLRAYYAFMWGYPGKKLLFMGQEFAQRHEWSEARALDWDLLRSRAASAACAAGPRSQYALPRSARAACPRLRSEGFEWLIADDKREFGLRLDAQGARRTAPVVVVSNFTPDRRDKLIACPLPAVGTWREIVNSDAHDYGGAGRGNCGAVERCKRRQALRCTLPPWRRSC